ncbi:MAG TPA: hypothetical protein VNH18_29515 [Bryobacteraceae bacterium]|nr:hypothetical protein [Bryobacteraceae bacterium]
MVIDYFDFVGVPVSPREANPVLDVDSDAVLALSIAFQFFQVHAGNNKILETSRGVELAKPNFSAALNGLKLSAREAMKHPFCFFVPARSNHMDSILRYA